MPRPGMPPHGSRGPRGPYGPMPPRGPRFHGLTPPRHYRHRRGYMGCCIPIIGAGLLLSAIIALLVSIF